MDRRATHAGPPGSAVHLDNACTVCLQPLCPRRYCEYARRRGVDPVAIRDLALLRALPIGLGAAAPLAPQPRTWR